MKIRSKILKLQENEKLNKNVMKTRFHSIFMQFLWGFFVGN